MPRLLPGSAAPFKGARALARIVRERTPHPHPGPLPPEIQRERESLPVPSPPEGIGLDLIFCVGRGLVPRWRPLDARLELLIAAKIVVPKAGLPGREQIMPRSVWISAGSRMRRRCGFCLGMSRLTVSRPTAGDKPPPYGPTARRTSPPPNAEPDHRRVKASLGLPDDQVPGEQLEALARAEHTGVDETRVLQPGPAARGRRRDRHPHPRYPRRAVPSMSRIAYGDRNPFDALPAPWHDRAGWRPRA